ncbi:hypothetical protein EST38_g11327 [Candolleomyces aberdarensis]|uniref:Uncharacterized protein n=1 Tax=Candolleomyces aberdarensis TaxID=2316362 RepID=A0A4Q2D537_9AGAR|nr:hypothetical protein EST38_g11327 [Candolleomyces aberdarensis]
MPPVKEEDTGIASLPFSPVKAEPEWDDGGQLHHGSAAPEHGPHTPPSSSAIGTPQAPRKASQSGRLKTSLLYEAGALLDSQTSDSQAIQGLQAKANGTNDRHCPPPTLLYGIPVPISEAGGTEVHDRASPALSYVTPEPEIEPQYRLMPGNLETMVNEGTVSEHWAREHRLPGCVYQFDNMGQQAGQTANTECAPAPNMSTPPRIPGPRPVPATEPHPHQKLTPDTDEAELLMRIRGLQEKSRRLLFVELSKAKQAEAHHKDRVGSLTEILSEARRSEQDALVEVHALARQNEHLRKEATESK